MGEDAVGVGDVAVLIGRQGRVAADGLRPQYASQQHDRHDQAERESVRGGGWEPRHPRTLNLSFTFWSQAVYTDAVRSPPLEGGAAGRPSPRAVCPRRAGSLLFPIRRRAGWTPFPTLAR